MKLLISLRFFVCLFEGLEDLHKITYKKGEGEQGLLKGYRMISVNLVPDFQKLECHQFFFFLHHFLWAFSLLSLLCKHLLLPYFHRLDSSDRLQ